MTVADALAGRDVCGKAKTGSGKTLAFGVPLLQRTMAARSTEPGRPRALVLVPTRELAVQVSEVLEPLANEAGLRIVAVYGGADIERQVKKLRRGVDVIIATPGRLIDLGDRGELSVADIETLVLDEADRMADMGFMPQVEWVLRRLERDAPDPSVLGHPGRGGRPAGQPLSHRPGPPRGGVAQHHRRGHGAPVPRGAPDGPGQGVCRHLS